MPEQPPQPPLQLLPEVQALALVAAMRLHGRLRGPDEPEKRKGFVVHIPLMGIVVGIGYLPPILGLRYVAEVVGVSSA